MKIKLFLLFSLFVSFGSAQTTEVTGGSQEIAVFNPAYEKNSKAQGTPYLTEEFLPAKLDYMDKTQLIRFNVVDNIIELKSNKGGNLMLDLRKDFTIELLDESQKLYRTGTYLEKGSKIRSFFEILNQTKDYTLYRKERKKFIKQEKVEAYKEEKAARFAVQNPKFYIVDFKSGGSVLLELPSKKKKFLSFFGNKEKEVGQFVKQEKLDFRNSNDLLQIIEFFFEK
ncbi:hypothetical protein [Maribacter sp. 2308TA10-17]|uniref:hypothetical protein n=1 Tax=Maribacter sp. 2308TA10-17 TaxID=3386276 RepID=UPI0039BC9C3C